MHWPACQFHALPNVSSSHTSCRRRRGTILIVAMILIFAIAALVLTLGRTMRVEAAIAANGAAAREATLIERGAEQYVLALLAESTEPVETLDQSYFEAVALGTGYFWILRPDYGDPLLPAFGLTDESAKIDLNTIEYARLRLLAGMTDEVASSIVDWRDEDDEPTEGLGAESQFYLSRTPGHEAKNAAYETVEELRLVEGISAEVLHGDGSAPPLGQGQMTAQDRPFENETYRVRGLFDLFTVWSAEATTSADGQQRIDVNDNDRREEVRTLLREVFGDARGGELAGRVPNRDVLDLFDFAVSLRMEPAELAQIEDRLAVEIEGQTGRGKINVNWAPREIMLTLPNLDEAEMDALISQRSTAVQDDPHSIAWVLDVLESRAIGLGRIITGRGAFYSADLLAVAGDGRAFKRVRIVVDTSAATGPQIVYRRDLSEQGWPMDAGILQSLRNGQGLQSSADPLR